MAGSVSKETLEHLVKETDMVLVIREYTPLEHHGALYTGQCPICHCDKNRFVVHPQRYLWRCFNCGKQGNVIDFLVEKECFTEVDAVKLLAGKAFDPMHAKLSKRSTAEAESTPSPSPTPPSLVRETAQIAPDLPKPAELSPPPPPTMAFKPAGNLFTLLRGVAGYKTAAVLSSNLSVLAKDTSKAIDVEPLFSEFMGYLSTPLSRMHETCAEFSYVKGSQLTLRSANGALIVVSDEYENQLIHLMCLLSSDGNLVLTRRYMADLLGYQSFLA